MSCNLDDPKLLQAYQAVLSSKTNPQWLVFGYNNTRDVLSFYTSGTGFASFQRTLTSATDEIIYGFIHVNGRNAIITYVNSNASGVRRARALVHGRSIDSFFKDHHVHLTIAKQSDLTEDYIYFKLFDSSPTSTRMASPKVESPIPAPIASPRTSIIGKQQPTSSQPVPVELPVPIQRKMNVSVNRNSVVVEEDADDFVYDSARSSVVIEDSDVDGGYDDDDFQEEVSPLSEDQFVSPPPPPVEFVPPSIAQPKVSKVASETKFVAPLKVSQTDDLPSITVMNPKTRLWVRRRYDIRDRMLYLYKAFDAPVLMKRVVLDDVKEIKPSEEEIVTKHSFRVAFIPSSVHHEETQGEPMYFYCDDVNSFTDTMRTLMTAI